MDDEIKSFCQIYPETIMPLNLLGVISPLSLDLIDLQPHPLSNIPIHTSSYLCNKAMTNDKFYKNHFILTNNTNYWENAVHPLTYIDSTFSNQNFLTLSLPYNKNSASNCVAFSPNSKHMALNIGNGKIILSSLCQLSLILNQQLDENKYYSSITIDCVDNVQSMIFGASNYSSAHFTIKNRITNPHQNTENVAKTSKTIVNKRFDFAREECILVTGQTNGQIKIWQVPTGRLMLILCDHKSAVTSLAFCPDPSQFKLLSGSSDRTFKIWDMNQDGNMCPTVNVTPHQTRITKLVWSPDVTRIITVGGSNKAHIWKKCSSKNTYKCIKSLQGHLNEIVDCDLSSDGALLLTACLDSYTILWDAYEYMAIRKFGHMFPPPRPIFASGPNGHGVRGVQFIPDTFLFTTISDDGYIRLWDMYSDQEVPIKIGRQDFPLCCRYTKQPSILATGDKYGRLMIWGMCDKHIHSGPNGTRQQCIINQDTNLMHNHVSDNDIFLSNQPQKLQHLCRSTLRSLIPDTHRIDALFRNVLPQKLLEYLKYHDIKCEDEVISPNYPYIISH